MVDEYCSRDEVIGDDGFSDVTASMVDMIQVDFETQVDDLREQVSRQIDAFTGRDFFEHDHSVTPKIYSVGRYSKRSIEIRGPIIGSNDNPSDNITKVETRGSKAGSFAEVDSDAWTAEDIGIYSDVVSLTKTLWSQEFLRRMPRGCSASTPSQKLMVQPEWWAGFENMQITYKYGFATTPVDIKRIAILQVDLYLRSMVYKRNKNIGSVTSLAAGDPEPIIDFADSVKEQLKMWETQRGRMGVI